MVIRNGSPDIDSDEEQFLHAIENQLEPLFIQTCRMVILSVFFIRCVSELPYLIYKEILKGFD